MASRRRFRVVPAVARASLIIALVAIGSGAAQAAVHPTVTQDANFNGRVRAMTGPDANGIRYIGGEFSSYRAWRTGQGALFDATTGAIDTSIGKIAGQNATASETVIPDGSGGWWVGGTFLNVAGTTVERVVHIKSDGTLDSTFTNPTVKIDGRVTAMARASLGGTEVLLIAGAFTKVNDVTRTKLAALDATTGALLNWAPTANDVAESIVVDGDIAYIGGAFTTISTVTRNRAAAFKLSSACITADWSLNAPATDSSKCLQDWHPNLNNTVYAVTVSPTRVYLGGTFTTVGTSSIRGLAAVLKTPAGNSYTDASFDAELNGDVNALIQNGSTIYAGGTFTWAAGEPRRGAAALDVTATGRPGLLPWDPQLNNASVTALATAGTRVYLGGSFTAAGVAPRNRLVAVDGTTGAAADWSAGVCDTLYGDPSSVTSIAATAAGVFVTGGFTCAGGETAMHVAATGPDGVLLDAPVWTNTPVTAMSLSGSTLYLAGAFTEVNGVSRTGEAAVTTDGTVTTWDPTVNQSPTALVATPTRIYLGGGFDTVGGVARRGVAAVTTTTGTLDASFDAGLDSAGSVNEMTILGNRLYLAGTFTSVRGVPRMRLAAVDPASGIAVAGFRADLDNTANTVVVDTHAAQPRLIVSGTFTKVGTAPNDTARARVAAVDAGTGAVDATWAPTVTGTVYAIAATAGAVYIAGNKNMNVGGVTSVLSAVNATTGALVPNWRLSDVGGDDIRTIGDVSDTAVYVGLNPGTLQHGNGTATAISVVTAKPLGSWPMAPADVKGLLVVTSGGGAGTVSSSPAGIVCGNACGWAYAPGTAVTLTASAANGSEFRGWTGACANAGTSATCQVTLAATASATARFAVTGAPDPEPGPDPQPGPSPSPDANGTSGSADAGTAAGASGTAAATQAPTPAPRVKRSAVPKALVVTLPSGSAATVVNVPCESTNGQRIRSCTVELRVPTSALRPRTDGVRVRAGATVLAGVPTTVTASGGRTRLIAPVALDPRTRKAIADSTGIPVTVSISMTMTTGVQVSATTASRLRLPRQLLSPEAGIFNRLSTRLNAEGRAFVDRAASMLPHRVRAIVCTGYADNTGVPGDNRWLGERRATALCSALAAKGIRADVTQVVSEAATKPRDTNDAASGRERNRRASIAVTY